MFQQFKKNKRVKLSLSESCVSSWALTTLFIDQDIIVLELVVKKTRKSESALLMNNE